MVESEGEAEVRTRPAAPVLTPPLSLEGGLAAELRPANLVQRVLSLFGNVRPGSDLSHFQLPATFNLPKSQLQLYGESVYCTGEDLLGRCAQGKDSLERLTSVVAWAISTTRPPIFGLAPYNPVLGETHHVSAGSLNVLLEQVSHRPPVSALHATDAGGDVELVWCQHPVPKFHGASIEATVAGRRQVRLPKHGETYEVDCPSLLIRLLPAPSVEWAGTVRVVCAASGLDAELSFCRARSFLGIGGDPRRVKGKVARSGSGEVVAEIEGFWDRTVTVKDVKTGKVSVLYDAQRAIGNLSTPVVQDQKRVTTTGRVAIGIRHGVGRGERRDSEEGLGGGSAGEAASGGHGEGARQGEGRPRGGVGAQTLLAVAGQGRQLGVLPVGGGRAAGSHRCSAFIIFFFFMTV